MPAGRNSCRSYSRSWIEKTTHAIYPTSASIDLSNACLSDHDNHGLNGFDTSPAFSSSSSSSILIIDNGVQGYQHATKQDVRICDASIVD